MRCSETETTSMPKALRSCRQSSSRKRRKMARSPASASAEARADGGTPAGSFGQLDVVHPFGALDHADGLQWGGLVERGPEVAQHGLLDLLFDLRPRLAQQLLDGAVEQRIVHVVDADAGRRIGAHGDTVGRIHAFDANVDRQDREVDGLGGLDEGNHQGPAALLDTKAVLAAVHHGLGAAGDDQDLVGRADPDQGAQQAQKIRNRNRARKPPRMAVPTIMALESDISLLIGR